MGYYQQSMKRRLWKLHRHSCHYCKVQLTYKLATVDHWHPVVMGGLTTTGNCRLACFTCNHFKGDMRFHSIEAAREYLEQRIKSAVQHGYRAIGKGHSRWELEMRAGALTEVGEC